jgi:hypothetical protein
MVHVPLIIAGLGVTPGRGASPTLNGGFFATVADVLDVWPPRHLQLPDLRGDHAEGVLVEVDYDPQSMKYSAKAAHQQAWIEADRKLIRDLDREIATYDLGTDPLERTPLSDQGLVSKLDAALSAAGRGALEREWKSTDEKAREMLEALGYLD